MGSKGGVQAGLEDSCTQAVITGRLETGGMNVVGDSPVMGRSDLVGVPGFYLLVGLRIGS